MDALDILGGLLGGGSKGRSTGGSGGGSLGGKILGDLLKSAMGGGRAPQPSPQPTSQQIGRNSNAGSSQRPMDIDNEARSLEELLGVATGKGSGSRQPAGPSSYRPAPEQPRYQPAPQAPAPSRSAPRQDPQFTTDDEAIVLIRALIAAAKADGRIDANEQQTILSQVPDDPQTVQFLKQEFAAPLDVREFAWSVPLGMEVKVYTMSLAGMRLDTNSEAQYLKELAHGLRMDPDLCRQIHARYGVEDVV